MEQTTKNVTKNKGFIKINDAQIGNIEHFELKRSQIPPRVYDPSMDIAVTKEIRSFEMAVSVFSRQWTGKICLVFNKANVHQASVLHSNSEFKFELLLELDEIAIGTACVESIEYYHDLYRNITFKVIDDLTFTRKTGE